MVHKEALSWSRLFALFSPREKPAPPGDYTSLATTFYTMGKAIWKDAALPQSKLILRQIRAEARKQGIRAYTDYLLFLLFEQSKYWPKMSKEDKHTLFFLRSIISEASDTPNYYAGLQVPVGDEKEFDAALRNLASWGRTTFRDRLEKDYLSVLNRYAGIASLHLYRLRTEPKIVREAFETQVLSSPNAFGIYGLHLWSMITLIQG